MVELPSVRHVGLKTGVLPSQIEDYENDVYARFLELNIYGVAKLVALEYLRRTVRDRQIGQLPEHFDPIAPQSFNQAELTDMLEAIKARLPEHLRPDFERRLENIALGRGINNGLLFPHRMAEAIRKAISSLGFDSPPVTPRRKRK